jgi:hypothetical protein
MNNEINEINEINARINNEICYNTIADLRDDKLIIILLLI